MCILWTGKIWAQGESGHCEQVMSSEGRSDVGQPEAHKEEFRVGPSSSSALRLHFLSIFLAMERQNLELYSYRIQKLNCRLSAGVVFFLLQDGM